jgi:hypothetical protein
MPCEVCGHQIAQKHRLRPGAWGGTYEPGNVVRLCPNHHAAIHMLMRWYCGGGRFNRKDQHALDEILDDQPLYRLWVERARPIVREKLAVYDKACERRLAQPREESRLDQVGKPSQANLGPHDHIGSDRTWPEYRESAYRRGYHQALAEVIDSIERGARDLETFRAWEREVHVWRYRGGRYRGPRSAVQRPPMTPGERIEFPHRWSDGSFRREEQPS